MPAQAPVAEVIVSVTVDGRTFALRGEKSRADSAVAARDLLEAVLAIPEFPRRVNGPSPEPDYHERHQVLEMAERERTYGALRLGRGR